MAELYRQRYDLGSRGIDLSRPVTVGEQLAANWRLGGTVQAVERQLQDWMPADPTYDKWKGIEGYEEYADRLLDAESEAQASSIKRQIDRNLSLQRAADTGPMNTWLSSILAGVADPTNLIPIPAVKGIGLVKGALAAGAATTAIGAGQEALRQYGDPTARPEEAVFNITIAGLIGAGFGAAAGAYGSRGRGAALRRLDGGLGAVDDPGPSLGIRLGDEGLDALLYERPRPGADGSFPRFAIVDELGDYVVKELDGRRYVWDDGLGWIRAKDKGLPEPRQAEPHIADQLGEPERQPRRVMRVDSVGNNKDFDAAGWQDELQGFIDDPAVNVENVIRNAKDYTNFRTREFLWQRQLPIKEGEDPAAWRQRVGRQAMSEHRASMAKMGYAGKAGIAWALEHLNFSPLAKGIRVFNGDNVLADSFLRIAGDFGWALKANEFNWSTPPSLLLNGHRHQVRFFQFQSEFDAEWLKFASGDQGAKGKEFMRSNLAAAGYSFVQGARRLGGQNVMTKDIFAEMTSMAVILGGKADFEHKGFRVNENARAAARAYSRMMEEYDELQRAAGIFKDQKQLTRDRNKWTWEILKAKHQVAKWLWGQSAEPSAYAAAVRVRVPGVASAAPGAALDPMLVEFDRLLTATRAAEKQSDPATWTPEERAAYDSGDWETFSRLRGYSEDEINDFRSWLSIANQVIARYGVDFAATREPGQPAMARGEPGAIRTFTGEDHESAVRAMVDELGPVGFDLSEKLKPGNYGYVPRVGEEQLAPTAEPTLPAGMSRRQGVDLERLKAEARSLEDDMLTQQDTPEWDKLFKRYSDVLDQMAALRKGQGIEDISLYANPVAIEVPEGEFVTVDRMVDERVAGLTDKQMKIYTDKRSALDLAEAQLAATELQLARVTDTPHRFVNAAGEPENYFTRFWNNSMVAANQEKLIRLITAWYSRDNPDGARARAEDTVGNILMENAGDALSRGNTSHLNQRILDLPNSFSIQDPDLGLISTTDFIDTNVLAVGEYYVRQAGNRIEAARMFGDHNLVAERMKNRQHILDTYYDKQTTDEGREAAMAKMREHENWFDLTLRSVFGSLRDTSPWRMDNRVATLATHLTSLALQGKVVLTTTSDAAHSAMAQGIGTFFRAAFQRMFTDMNAAGKSALKLNGLTSELLDFARTRHTMMAHQMENGKPVVGGTWLENEIARRMPGFFKINALTPMTMWLKDVVGIAAQHNVMTDAIRIGELIRAGNIPSKADALRLNALGIKPRDAEAISRMAYQRTEAGLTLPVIDDWTGPDARRAQAAILTAIHAEMRRSVVTPSIGDRSTIFNGVWTSSTGEKVGESDLLKIPMQFLAYGVAAHNKVLSSFIQGRDRSMVMGLFFMMMAGAMTNWLRSDSRQWQNKTWDQHMFEAWETAGISGFWFGDLNRQIEKVTNNQVGLRPLMGVKPGFTRDSQLEAMIAGMGAAPSIATDLFRAFTDPSISGNRRASMMRRAVAYNNVLWWDRLARDFTGETVELFGGQR